MKHEARRREAATQTMTDWINGFAVRAGRAAGHRTKGRNFNTFEIDRPAIFCRNIAIRSLDRNFFD
jgi:hypothetical protein